jgi:hypothetical protein
LSREGETVEIAIAPAEVDLTDATLVVGVLAGNEPAPGAEEALAAADPALLELAKFEGKTGQVLTLPHPDAKAVVFVGLGDEAGFEAIRSGAGNAIRVVKGEQGPISSGLIRPKVTPFRCSDSS